jgi:hypothetical protein
MCLKILQASFQAHVLVLTEYAACDPVEDQVGSCSDITLRLPLQVPMSGCHLMLEIHGSTKKSP